MKKHQSFMTQKKAEQMQQFQNETNALTARELRCPECNFLLETLFSDLRSGHAQRNCPKCKSNFTYNYAYFRTRKNFRKY